MKSIRKHKCAGFFIRVISFFIFVSIILIPSSVFAVNTDLVYDPFGTAWIGKGKYINLNNRTFFDGSLNYISDVDEGCFYLFFQFRDERIDPTSNENIALSFTVKNDVNTYKFQIDETGLLGTSSKNSFDAIDVYYNFDDASCGRKGGVIYAAFKLKNPTDRKLNNKISCEYSCGYDCIYLLFNDLNLDMYVPTTIKESSTKSTTSKNTQSTTAKKSTDKSNSNPTITKTTTEASTKFSGSGKLSTTSKNNTAKFSGTQKPTDSITIVSDEDGGNYDNEDGDFETIIGATQANSQEENAETAKSEMSRQAKLLLIIFAVLFALGIACVVIGTLNSKKNEKEEQG